MMGFIAAGKQENPSVPEAQGPQLQYAGIWHRNTGMEAEDTSCYMPMFTFKRQNVHLLSLNLNTAAGSQQRQP